MRNSITVLVLGDEGVGKSSLISTFVSHHFSEAVPGIMTRVRLPPDPQHDNCITTIVDSQGGDAALIAALATLSLTTTTPTTATTTGTTTAATESVNTTEPSTAAAAAAANNPMRPSSTNVSSTFPSSSSTSLSTSATTTTMGIDHVDSIVLVYDLDRIETFYRLENHWLPLIEQCYHGEMPVIVAGNKMDLLRPSGGSSSARAGMTDEQALARSRQEIVSLLQRFRFVRQCIKCSAKNLLRVDEVFGKAQQAVLYPFTPLYDLNTGRLTDKCQKALTRIFRMYDRDNDGLLSNTELDAFQNQTFHVPLVEKDLAGWKKVVTRNNPTPEQAVVNNGKFTVSGFLAIFDVFISQNRLDVPWRVLRKFGYDNDLVLHVPLSVTGESAAGQQGGGGTTTATTVGETGDGRKQSWNLSHSARNFLAAMFHQFDSNHDGMLSADDVAAIFSILPEPSLPPWHPLRLQQVFDGCFSRPKVVLSSTSSSSIPSSSSQPSSSSSPESGSPAREGPDGTTTTTADPMALSQSLSASGITICSASSLPTVDLSTTTTASPIVSQPMSFLDWMGQWHMVSAISPSTARAELYRLGHVEDGAGVGGSMSSRGRRRRRRATSRDSNKKRARRKSSGGADFSSVMLPSREIRVLVLGSRGSGKTALLNCLLSSSSSSTLTASDTSPTETPETSHTYIKLKQSSVAKGSTNKPVDEDDEECAVHLIFTEVPQAQGDEANNRQMAELKHMVGAATSKARSFDIVVFTFDSSKEESLEYAKEMEAELLVDDVARVYVATKVDTVDDSVLNAAKDHCKELDLESPLLTSATDSMLGSKDVPQERARLLEQLAGCVLEENGMDQLRAKPHAEKKRKEAAKRRKMIWLGGLVSVSVAVAVGVGVLWRGVGKGERKDGHGLGGWLRHILGGGIVGMSPSSSTQQ